MICKTVFPAPILQQYIKEYLVLHTKFDVGIVPVKAYPVNPEEGITFVLRGGFSGKTIETGELKIRPRTNIYGLATSRQDLYLTAEYLMIKVYFKPGGLHKLLGIPMFELLHQYIEGRAILGKEISEVENRLDNAITYDELSQILDNYFSNKVRQIKFDLRPVDKIGTMILANPQGFNLSKTANEACLSVRQFERRFEEQIGVTPKYYARICRFYEAYVLKEKFPELDWLSIAIRTGYSDYQHLVKDFKQFAGESPNALIQKSNLNPERILGLNPDFVGI
jgi:AraC-like DNA-binding protein